VDKFDRIFQLHVILSQRRTPIPLEELMAKLECSKSTVLRTINTLKNHLNAPVVFDADAGGYKYGKPETGEAFELPGLWFTAHELQALALMQRLIKDAGGGLLEEHFGALAKRLDELTKHQRLSLGEAAQRLRFPAIAARPAGTNFNTVAQATLKRLITETGARAVYWNRLYDVGSIARDKALVAALAEAGIEAKSFNASLLFEPWEVATGAGGFFRVFTPFWKAVRGATSRRRRRRQPASRRRQPGPPRRNLPRGAWSAR